MNARKKLCESCTRFFDKEELVKGRYGMQCPECKRRSEEYREMAHNQTREVRTALDKVFGAN
jgi:hypothetical protein